MKFVHMAIFGTLSVATSPGCPNTMYGQPNNFGNSSGSQGNFYQGQAQYQGQAPPYQGPAPPYQGQAPYDNGFSGKGGSMPPPFTGVAPSKNPSQSSIPRKQDEMFQSNQWRDLWAAVLYYAHLAGAIVILGLYAQDLKGIFTFKSLTAEATIIIGSILGSLVLAVLLVSAFLSIVHRAPESVIKTTLITSVAFNVVSAVSCMFIPGGIVLGVILLIFAAINGLIFFMWRDRIPFSSVLLKTVVEVFRVYPQVWTLGTLMVVTTCLFSCFYGIAISGVVAHMEVHGQEKADPLETFCILYLVFSTYWSFQVIENVVHTTVAGTMASFYFLSGSAAAIANPVWMSLRRAMTLSFGSICFGSLIVAIIQFMRFLLRSARGRDKDNIVAVLADCFLRIIEDIATYLNFYAYVHVAIYGKPFIPSAKETWEMIKNHGVDVIINDSIVGTCMNIAAFLIGCINAVVTFAVVALCATGVGDGAIVYAYIGAGIGFFLGLFVSAVAFQLIASAVSTTLVCYAENPGALQATKPELYQQITSKYRYGV